MDIHANIDGDDNEQYRELKYQEDKADFRPSDGVKKNFYGISTNNLAFPPIESSNNIGDKKLQFGSKSL